MRGEVLGLERRRRWSDDEKLSIVREVSVGGASTTQVAQRHEVTMHDAALPPGCGQVLGGGGLDRIASWLRQSCEFRPIRSRWDDRLRRARKIDPGTRGG